MIVQTSKASIISLSALGEGVPQRHANTGEKITHRLASGENEKVIAKRLTLKIFNAARGDEMAGFHHPIRYERLVF